MIKVSILAFLRNFSKLRLFYIIRIIGLSIGFISSFIIIQYLYNQLSYDEFHSNKKNIYRILLQENGENTTALIPFVLPLELQKTFAEIEKCARIIEIQQAFIKKGSNYLQEPSFQAADPELFEVLTIPFISGNINDFNTNTERVVISESFAKKLFSDSNPINQVLEIIINNRKIEVIVTGVYKDLPINSTFKANIIGHIDGKINGSRQALNTDNLSSGWRPSICSSYILLNSSTSIKDITSKANSFIKKNLETDSNIYIKFQNITRIYLSSQHIAFPYFISKGNLEVLIMILIIGVIIMGASIFNYLSISIVISSERIFEVGIRKTLGASNSELSKQFIQESIYNTLLAFIISIFSIYLLTPFINNTFSISLESKTIFNLKSIIIDLSIVIALAFISGGYLAYYAISKSPINILTNRIFRLGKPSLLYRILLCSQLIIFVGILSFSNFINNQLEYTQNMDLGFNSNNIIKISGFSPQINKTYLVFKERLLQNPNILSVSGSTSSPPSINSFIPFEFPTLNDDKKPVLGECVYIDSDFLRTFEIALLKGRNFKVNDKDANVVIINEEALKTIMTDDLIGKKLGERNVIGVIEDFHLHSIYEQILPLAFLPLPNNYLSEIQIKAIENYDNSNIEYINKIWRSLYPNESIKYSFIDNEIKFVYNNDKMAGKIIKLLSYLSLIIAALGLFGVSLISLKRRAKEFAIHKIHGAKTGRIYYLLIKEYLLLSVISFIVAVPISYYLYINYWLINFAYKDKISLMMFFSIFLMAVLIVLISVILHTIKIYRTKPIEVLSLG